MSEKKTLEEVLLVAAPLTFAKNALRSGYGPEGGQIAIGWLGYVMRNYEPARDALIEECGIFDNFLPDEAKGLIAGAQTVLLSNANDLNPCVQGIALGKLGKAHKILSRFNRSLGFADITNEQIIRTLKSGKLTVGGGGR